MAISGPKKTVLQTVSVVILMGGLAWASVPLYDLFCRVTGFGGVPGQADAGSDVILDQTIKVRFDGSLNSGMPWEFKPVAREMEIRIGETGLAFYEAYNPTDRPVAGQASYNVTPILQAGFSTRLIVSALQSKFSPPVSGCRCRSAFMWTQKSSMTAMGSLYIPSLCPIHSMKLTCPKAMPPWSRTTQQV